MIRNFALICLSIIIFSDTLWGQSFTRQDTLRGSLNPMRTCYDVTYYELDIRVDPEKTFYCWFKYNVF